MPPRYAYWTILVDDQPTAFRAALQEDLMPTFKRLKEKHASARIMWWQNGKLWASRLDAQEAMRARGDMGRRGDARQGGGFSSALSERRAGGAPDRGASKGDRNREREQRPDRGASGKLEWKPKDPSSARAPGPSRPTSRPQDPKTSRPRREPAREKLEWRPKGEALVPRDHLVRRNLRDRTSSRPQDKTSRPRRDDKLEWKPKGAASDAPKRKWVPKEEYKKSQGIEARRDKNWRPGGEHKDPRQKYKDAKKAKWSRFKQNIRQKWEARQDRPAPGKRRDKE